MKKIFILTGEPSGDKLASKVILQLKNLNLNIEYLCVGGEHLNKLNIKSIYNLKDITYIGFTSVLFNIFKIKKKINETANKIIEFNPDILFSVDSPDFTLRVANLVKKKNSKIKTIHYVAPQVWIWRKGRVKKIKKFIDHILLLFNFEKKYFEEENMLTTFVGHPLLESVNYSKIEIGSIIDKEKKIISIFPGSRISEINTLMPILISFIKLSQADRSDLIFVFHTINSLKSKVISYLKDSNIKQCEVISDENIKKEILSNSMFAIAKSGTVSLEICNLNVSSIIIYKINFINFFIIKSLINVKFANIVNIISNNEVIPELLQSKCNASNIYKNFNLYINDKNLRDKQIVKYKKVLNQIKTDVSPSKKISEILSNYLY